MSNWLAKLDRRSRLLSEANSPYYNRRVHMLSRHLASAIPGRGTVLDIGAGDGQIALALMRLRPDLRVEGVDTVARPRTPYGSHAASAIKRQSHALLLIATTISGL